MSAVAENKGGVVGRDTPEAAGNPPMPVASFSIPAPPSANALFRNVKGRGRAKTKVYEDWRMHCGWALRAQGIEYIDYPCVVVLGVERHSKQADIDNRNKALLDALVHFGVLKDDSLVTAIFSVWQPRANHMARVQIFPCQPMSLTFHPSQNGTSGALLVASHSNQGDDHGLIAE